MYWRSDVTLFAMKINRLDHVGINVLDMAAAKAFFLELGFELMGEMHMEGEWLGKIIGLTDVSDDICMLKTPGGEAYIELVQFHSPVDAKGLQPAQSNTLGMRHICLNVEGLEALVAKVQQKGMAELMGTIHNYENMYRLCYIRGPEGIIVELAEEIS